MIRLGIIGTESSRTGFILDRIKTRDDVCVTAIWGEEVCSGQQIAEHYPECMVPSLTDMLDKVDAVMLTMRDGAYHLEVLRPFIMKKIPVWIDKPFAASVADGKELADLLQKTGTLFDGGSCVKLAPGIQEMKWAFCNMKDECLSGYLSFNIKLDSPYSGMHYYSHHLIECMLEVFGKEVCSVFAKRVEESLTAVASYQTFSVLMNFAVGNEPFYGGVFGKTHTFVTPITYECTLDQQVDNFLDMVMSGDNCADPQFFLTAVRVSNAIEQSVAIGREVEIWEVG